MASKRKSSVPCMIPVRSKHLREEIVLGCLPELLPTIPEDSILSISSEEAERTIGEFERGTHSCPPCSFQTKDLKLFLSHMDGCHMDFHTQPIFYCQNCKVSLENFDGLALHNTKTHTKLQVEESTSKVSLLVTKRDGVLTVEQMLFTEKEDFSEAGISITKTPIMKMMFKGEPRKIAVSHTEVQRADTIPEKPGGAGRNAPPSHTILPGTAFLPISNVNAAIPVTQNLKSLWNSAPSTDSNGGLPKVMIPLSSIPTYDPAMDLSSFLNASFGKFPYPTKAELCYLTVVSGFPEEQIKLWFTAQRLKQGISWSPEEIEDTRKRMFNTVFQVAPKFLQRQSHPQIPQHCVSGQLSSVSTSFIPHAPKGSVIGRKGGVIVSHPGRTQGSSLKHQSMVETPPVTVQHGIITMETGNGLSSQKAERSTVNQANITSSHKHVEKTEPGCCNSVKAVGSVSPSQTQSRSYSEGSIMNLTNIVRKIDCNVNSTNCTSKPNMSSASIYGPEKTTSDTNESSIATSSKCNIGSPYESTSHRTICTKKEVNVSDDTSKAKNTISSVICSRTGLGEHLLVQNGSLLEPFLSKNKSKLPERLEASEQSFVHSSLPAQKLLSARDVPVWDADKLNHSRSSADSQLALELFINNMPQTSLFSNDIDVQEDQFSKSVFDQPEKPSPKSLLRAPQDPSADFTVVPFKDCDSPTFEEHLKQSKAVLERSHFNNTAQQRETADGLLEQLQNSQTNNPLFTPDKDEPLGTPHLIHASQKDEVKKSTALKEIRLIRQYTDNEEDQWENNSSYPKPKTESIKTSIETLHELQQVDEASRKQICNQKLYNQSTYVNGPSEQQDSHQHSPAKEHFVEVEKYIMKKSLTQDDQTKCGEPESDETKAEYLEAERQSIFHSLAKKNPEEVNETSENTPAKDHWLMNDEEDNQSRDCVRGELLKV